MAGGPPWLAILTMVATPGRPENAVALPKVVVCHVTTYHSPVDVRIFHKECLALVQAGYEVHFVVPHDRDEIIQGVHIHALPKPTGRLKRMLFWPWLAYRKVLSLRPRPVICHFHDSELLFMGMALRLKGFKVIYDVHENVAKSIMTRYYLPRVLRVPASWCYRFLEKLLTSGIATVHVLDTIARRYREPKSVICNYPLVEGPLKPTAKKFEPPWTLIYVGGVSADRGGIRMLQLLEDLLESGTAARLKLVGRFSPDSFRDELIRYAEEHRISDHVELLGRVPWERCQREISEADLGLCLLDPTPNYTNGLPVKGFEYMAHGLPSLASNFACYRPVFVDTHSGVLVDPLDRRAILQAAQELLTNPRKMADMGQRGQRAVYESLNWQSECRKLLNLYERILGSLRSV